MNRIGRRHGEGNSTGDFWYLRRWSNASTNTDCNCVHVHLVVLFEIRYSILFHDCSGKIKDWLFQKKTYRQKTQTDNTQTTHKKKKIQSDKKKTHYHFFRLRRLFRSIRF